MDWRDLAACVGEPPELFHPRPLNDDGVPVPQPEREALAVAVCKLCPVKVECLRFAESAGVNGIWGGVYVGMGDSNRTAKYRSAAA